jgi:hypothetical protein
MKKILLLSAVLLGAATASQAGGFHFGFHLPLPPLPLPPLPGIVIGRPAPPVYYQQPAYSAPVCPPGYYAPPCYAQPYYYPGPSVYLAPPSFSFGYGGYRHDGGWDRRYSYRGGRDYRGGGDHRR